MRRKDLTRLAGWLTLPAVLVGLLVWVYVYGRDVVEQGYALWPPSANAIALLQGGLRWLVGAWAILLVLVALPLLRWGGHAERRVRIAWIWSAMLVVPPWAWYGLRFNRYEVGSLWRSSMELGPVRLPAALGSGHVWLVNLGLSLGALLLGLALGKLWKMWLPSMATYRAPRWWERSATLFALLGILAAWIPLAGLRPTPGGGDVILISLDAFRADRLKAFGGEGRWTPRLDEFARDATVYSHAYCQEPWTLTSHMSMLSGLYPDVHGLDFGRSLPPAVWTLPECLRDAGWRTLASVYDCLFLAPRFGYGDGFDHYEVSDAVAAPRARAMARRVLGGGTSFVFLHFYDPHSDRGKLPYESNPATRKRVAPGAAKAFEGWAGPGGASETLAAVNEGKVQLDSLQRRALEELYDAGVADTDTAVGLFLDELRRAGRYDNALIIILADHGEALGESSHGRPHYMHEELMEQTLHIPLMVKYPDGHTGTDDRLAETVDILPTVCSSLGIPVPALVQGQSLRDESATRQWSFARSGENYAITDTLGRHLRYRWDDKFGVQFDPADSANDVQREAALEAIERFHRANRALAERLRGGDVELSKADEALLRSLGYVQ